MRWRERWKRCGREAPCNFVRSESGNAAVIFGICLIPVIAVAGGTVDYIAAAGHRATLQSAVDAAALAGARAMDKSDDEIKQIVRDFVKASSDEIFSSAALGIAINRDAGRVIVDAVTPMPTTFMRVVGIDKLDLGTRSEVVQSVDKLEIALVMDNTGSMGQRGKLSAMKDAATKLVDILTGASPPGSVKFAVVPFSTFANVGSDKAGADWIDNSRPGLSPIHTEIFSKPANRLDLYARLKVSWRGCVEARPAPYDSNDAVPSAANPATLFVPAFAPDEPDMAKYGNSYLKDVPVAVAGGLTGAALERALQANIDKYVLTGLFRPLKSSDTNYGPNYGCGIQPILPLTTDPAKVKNHIKNMVASGWTNIAEGAIWGLRVLSPEPPFSEGKPWTTKDLRKIIVLLTDGKNEIGSESNANGVEYNAYGYLWNRRLGLSVGATYNQIQSKLNEKTVTACANAKDKEITIYTIRLEERDQGVKAVLQSCASKAEYFFDAPSAEDLVGVFERIAAEITKLRIDR